MKVNKELKEYIEKNIFPSYEKNDAAHNIDHIKYVIERSLKFASTIPNINYDMAYVIAAYHDIAHYIDAKKHEEISSKILLADEKLQQFFSDEQIKIMADAVYDHRSSMDGEPRSIYGKIVSSADRNTSMESTMKRLYAYRLKHNPSFTLEEMIEDSRLFLLKKFGKNGYANEKIYFEDEDFANYLKQADILGNDKEEFKRIFLECNGLCTKTK